MTAETNDERVESRLDKLLPDLENQAGDPLSSAPNVIREAAVHDFSQYRFLFEPEFAESSSERD